MNIKFFLISLWFNFSCQSIRAVETITINSADGNFKLQEFEGNVTAHLRGSCLIHNLRGNILWEGKWSKIYEKQGRSIYKGEGKVIVKGTAKVIHFLGRSINSKISGISKIILYPSLMQGSKNNFYKYEQEKENHVWGLFSLDTLWLPKK